MGESNAVIIRKAYEDFAQANISAVFASFDAGITWHVPGHSPLSGDYTGHDQIGGFFQRTMELSIAISHSGNSRRPSAIG
jgi:ketosteroid isomerase-like protein